MKLIPASTIQLTSHGAGPATVALAEALPPERNPALVYLGRLTSAHSRRTMRGCLAAIAVFVWPEAPEGLGPEDYPWWTLGYPHAAAVRRVLAERPSLKTGKPLSVSRVNLHLAALRGVLEECWRLGLMSSEEYRRAADVKGIKGSVLPRGRHLHPGEIRDLFRACAQDGSSAAIRDAALLAIGYGAGLRISEVVALGVEDFDVETGEVKVRQAKGRKDRNVYVLDGASDAIEAWLLVRGGEPGRIFRRVDRWGNVRMEGLTERAVFKRLERRRDQAGVKTYSPHDLRRTFAGDLLDAGVDLSTVQDLMGHASPTTTKRYDRRDNRRKREAALRVRVPYVGPR